MYARIKKLPKIYKYILILLILLLIFAIFFFLLASFFPIKSTTSNLSKTTISKLVSPWPISALDQEYQERKRLKRYARSEQKRRLERQLQRMNTISVPIYDLSQDEEADVISNQRDYYPGKTDYLWPIIPIDKSFNNLKQNKKIVNLLLPFENWTSLFEGIYLSGGDEVKANIPIIKDRRYLQFLIFPLTPGNVRIILGQYVWAKTFNEDDVQRVQKINIPINDPTATNIRILSISSSCYLLDTSINQIIRNAREPIKISIGSSLWLPDKKLLINQFKEDNIPYEDDEDADLLHDNTDPLNKTDEEQSKQPDDNKSSTVENQEPAKTLEAEKDPLLQVANSQMLVNSNYTTAFGYNVVFIQAPRLDTELFKNQATMLKLAPNLAAMMENSVFFDENIKTLKENNSTFRETIYPNYQNLYDDNMDIFKFNLEKNINKNTYLKFRRYGYKVVSIAPPEALFFSNEIANEGRFSNFYNRWLNEKDWQFESRNLKIDEKSSVASGLDAIFNLDNSKKIQPPLNSADYAYISKYYGILSKNIGKVPNWSPNQYMLISNQDFFMAKIANAFQSWTAENIQTRFFAHLLMESQYIKDRPYLTNLKKAITSSGLKSITNPKYLKKWSEISYFDLALGDILNTIKARRMENRTLVFILLPNGNTSKLDSGIYKIPGLIGKKIPKKEISIKDILSTLFSNIGIPTGKNLSGPENSDIEGNMLELASYIPEDKFQIRKENFMKYSLYIKPNEQKCDPLLWKSNGQGFFGLSSNFPVFRIIDSNVFEIFPCSIPNKYIEISWYQHVKFDASVENEPSDEFLSQIGGHFFYLKNNKNFPDVYFGKNLISSKSLAFMFKNMSEKKLRDTFFVNSKESKQIQIKMKEYLFGFSEMSDEKNTKVALLVTPL